MDAVRLAVLTVSDRGFRGERVDTSGPAAAELARAAGAQVTGPVIVPDDEAAIVGQLRDWCDGGTLDVVITSGGTGFTPRDRTPEATAAVIERPAGGVAEVLRIRGLEKTPFAALSRGIAGIRGKTLVVNLPGSEKAVRENMAVLLELLPHAVAMLREGGEHGVAAES